MTYRAKLITTYKFQPSDLLLFDTNIWFYIYGPTDLHNSQTATYSKALGDILSAQSQIYIDGLIVSEFINLYSRTEHKLQSTTPFKTFRQSVAFKPIAQNISAIVKRILRDCQRVESGFSTCDITDLLDVYGKGKSDFNDLILTQICQDKGLKLVTHDGDFKGKNLTVITANHNLIRK